jgi:hypothetical protein
MIREEKLETLIPNEPKITTGQVVATPTASPPRQLGLTQRPRKGSGNAGAGVRGAQTPVSEGTSSARRIASYTASQ